MQKVNSGVSVPTAQHIDVEPTTRVTRRQSREKEEKERAEKEKAEAALRSSSSSNDIPVSSKGNIKTDVQESKAEIKSSSTSTAALKKAAVAKVKKNAPKVNPQKIVGVSKSKSKTEVAKVIEASSPPVAVAPVVQTRKPPKRRKLKRTDPSHCLEIIAPMYDIFYKQEEDYLVTPYMTVQKDINNRMRGILVDWLVEVHYKFNLQAPTLWMCVNLLDRYLQKKCLLRNKLQLLGVTCLLVACKFEEIYPPEVRDCVYITDKAYSREEVLAMEQSVLSELDYNLCVPTGYNFLTRYLNLIHASEKVRNLAFYYAERNLQESVSLIHKPCKLVSGALFAALFVEWNECYRDVEDADDEPTGSLVWPEQLVEETGFDEDDLNPLARVLVKHVNEEPVTTSMRHLIAAKKKYLNDKFYNVAELPLPIL